MNVIVKDKIAKPLKEVRAAIVEANHLCNYFTSSASADLVEDTTVTWTWKDYNVSHDVQVVMVGSNKIVLKWNVTGLTTRKIEIDIAVAGSDTAITIKESSFDLNEKEVKEMMDQTQGWTHFICSLKAYLYTGINLRTGKQN